MDYKAIIKTCRELGCCDACCVRYCALRRPTIFGDIRQFIKENTDTNSNGSAKPNNQKSDEESEGTPAKKMKTSGICVSCLGILQEDGWPECLNMSKEVMDNKKYETSTFACALSAPLATIIREKVMLLKLAEKFPVFDSVSDAVTPLKEAWKWSLGARLASHLGMTLDSGACAPLMITLSMEYEDDSLEAEVFAPSAEQLQRRQRRQRAAAPVTRCLLDRALDGISLSSLLSLLSWTDTPAPARGSARCVAVHAHHAPIHLAGRYIKLSRELPQSPWVLQGKRIMESSVQEIIFQPIADLYRFTPEEAEHRLKFQSAGREDVDVRCLGDGRPFAIEIADPRRALTAEELTNACEEICRSGKVWVHTLTPIHKDRLAELKAGEETKLKTYEALCIKLTHSPDDISEGATNSTPVRIYPRDLTRCVGSSSITRVFQRTPLRVLHRRALAVRERAVTVLQADPVPGHIALFTVRVRTPAGTYVKEWAHGEAGRTRPSLAGVLQARADIVALDVTQVQLEWP